ncbi:MAG: TolC family protein, partial [Polyangiaceae bacterium]
TESSAVAESRVREARDRLAQGVATDLEVLEAVGVERAYARLERIAGARVLLAETNLRHLLGLGRDEPLVLAAQLDDSLPESPAATAALIRRAQSSSPDLAAARARVEAAEARAASRESKLYPSLTASFNVNYDNPNPRIFPQEERFIATWDATVALRWSLDATIIGVAQRDQLDHLANQQRLALAQLENRVDEQVIAAAGDVDAALLGVEKARFDAGAARRRIEQRRQLHASGMATLTELADAENAWLSARLALVDALAEARVAAAALHRATGSSQPPPLEPRR